MTLTYSQLDDYFSGALSNHSFFSTGTVIILDGLAWELVEVIGDQYFFRVVGFK